MPLFDGWVVMGPKQARQVRYCLILDSGQPVCRLGFEPSLCLTGVFAAAAIDSCLSIPAFREVVSPRPQLGVASGHGPSALSLEEFGLRSSIS